MAENKKKEEDGNEKLNADQIKSLQMKYLTHKRECIGEQITFDYLQNRDIPVQKFNYSLDKRYQNYDHYFAILKLNIGCTKISIHNLKP